MAVQKKTTQKYRNTIRGLYSKSSLSEISRHAISLENTPAGNIEFLTFQKRIMEENFKGFDYQFATLSIARTNEAGQITDMSAVNLNLSDEVIVNYLQNIEHDNLTPLVYANPGRALNYTHVCRPETIKQHPMFVNHCAKYGIHHVISVGFEYPGHDKTFIAFDYMGGDQNNNWAEFDHIKLELATFPFALSWLYRNERFDETYLQRMMFFLEGLTESSLLNLRKYMNAPHQSLKEQAQDLGIAYGTYKDSLGDIRNQKITKSPEFTSSKAIPLRILEEHYGFLKLLGDHTVPLNKAMKPTFWP